jgi:predicted glycoside hydrolase/deacetylase ChbG (UPF0249 family)
MTVEPALPNALDRLATKYLVVNADDFGQSPGVNRGIIEAHERGIVTSASLMVRWDSSEQAAEYFRHNPDLSPGLHFELGEWAFRGGAWVPLYEVIPVVDADAVRAEAYRQLDMFRELLGRDPMHIDSHQHVHLREPVGAVLREISTKLGIPLRHASPSVRYCGDFYGQTGEGSPTHDAIQPEALIKILRGLGKGWTELCCHPAVGKDLDTMYDLEREMELEALCDPCVRTAIVEYGIELRSFGELA